MSANDPWSWVIGLLFLFVAAMCLVAAWEGYWTWRKEQADLARDRQARNDKAVRTWMDRGAA